MAILIFGGLFIAGAFVIFFGPMLLIESHTEWMVYAIMREIGALHMNVWLHCHTKASPPKPLDPCFADEIWDEMRDNGLFWQQLDRAYRPKEQEECYKLMCELGRYLSVLDGGLLSLDCMDLCYGLCKIRDDTFPQAWIDFRSSGKRWMLTLNKNKARIVRRCDFCRGGFFVRFVIGNRQFIGIERG